MGNASNVPRLQLDMPGMPPVRRLRGNASTGNLGPGTYVKYIGAVGGGPSYGTSGFVRRTGSGRAYVDMGRSGRWHIPFYLLFVAPGSTPTLTLRAG
jgi:hypothetical protein